MLEAPPASGDPSPSGGDAPVAPTLTAGCASARFEPASAHVRIGPHALTLRARAITRSDARAELGHGTPIALGSEVHTERAPGVVEWWRADDAALEHGITLAERPHPSDGGELSIELEVGGLTPVEAGSDAALLADASGRPVATYSHLLVTDADGSRVPAVMHVEDGNILLAVRDAGARYPLVVDPWLAVEEATFWAFDAQLDDNFGGSVSLSGDATIALIGVRADQTPAGPYAGSARVFSRSGTVWTEEVTLIPPGQAADDGAGADVALTADGTRALIGVPYADTAGPSNAGAVHVFVQSAGAWTWEAVLHASDAGMGDAFGGAVAVSGDGTVAVIGASSNDTAAGTEAGSAYIFVRSGTTWQEEAEVFASTASISDRFGSDVAVSSDGSTVLVGAWYDNIRGAQSGSAHVFTRPGTTWQQEALLLAPDETSYDAFGFSVALSGDGNLALVGARGDSTTGGISAGSARVFVRSGTIWTHEAMLVAGDGAASDGFGCSVALSPDGTRALVGVWQDDTPLARDAGSARYFTHTGALWTEELTLSATDGAIGDWLGLDVALAADGSRALAGTPSDGRTLRDEGSVRVFVVAETNAPNGTACGSGAGCVSGFCVDGVCCDTDCGGGAPDCQSCALVGGTAGTCSVVPSGIECRGTAGACDVAEACNGTSVLCPSDALAAGVACRAAVGPCDETERCDGVSATCPVDAFVPAATPCRVAAGPCDAPDVCSGTSAACPDSYVTGAMCRPAIGPCDVDETCDGSGVSCPPDAFAAGGTECAPSTGEDCDAQDLCSGSSADCVPTFLSGVECRRSAGPCDPAESCLGVGASCPPDLVSPMGVECRAATSTSCDPAEACDGTNAACPPDVTACGLVDAGTARVDAAGADAGGPIVEPEGCACRAGRSGRTATAPLAGLVLVLSLVGRRRRGRRDRGPRSTITAMGGSVHRRVHRGAIDTGAVHEPGERPDNNGKCSPEPVLMPRERE